MSTISGLGNNSALFTVSGQKQSGVSTDASSSGGSTTYVSTSAVTASQADGGGGVPQVQQGGGHHHHHHGNQELFQKIKSAVTSALQSSDGSSDPNKAVEDAIAGVLKENGGGGASGAAGPGGTPAQGAGSGGANGTAKGGDSQGAFSQLLESYGIDSAQFRSDLRTAFQNARQGDADAGAALQSVPSGTVFSAET